MRATEERFGFRAHLKVGVSFEEVAFFRRGFLSVAQVTKN